MLIAVDHGNKQIKTVHTPPFTSGLIQSDTPGFGTDALTYRGKYYTLTDQRIPYRRNKTEDERFFILTLFAIAHEIEAMGQYSGSLMRVQNWRSAFLPRILACRQSGLSTISTGGVRLLSSLRESPMPFSLKIPPVSRSPFLPLRPR